MNKLLLEKGEALDLKKRPQNIYDKLKEDYHAQLKNIKEQHHDFVDNILIPQIKLFNSIGFYAKGFNYSYIESSIEGFEFDIFSNYFKDLGLKCFLKDSYGTYPAYIYIDWRDSVTKTSNQRSKETLSTLATYLKKHYSDFNNNIYEDIEKFIQEKVFPKMLENNLGNRTLKVNLPEKYSGIFCMITFVEIFKKNGIYAEPELFEFKSLDLDWSQSYDNFAGSYDFDVYDAKCFIDCFEGKLNERRISHMTLSTAIELDTAAYRDVRFYKFMLDTVEIPVTKKVQMNIKLPVEHSNPKELKLENAKSQEKVSTNNLKVSPMTNPAKRIGFIISCTLFIQCDVLILKIVFGVSMILFLSNVKLSFKK